jgi:hypothetical protein
MDSEAVIEDCVMEDVGSQFSALWSSSGADGTSVGRISVRRTKFVNFHKCCVSFQGACTPENPFSLIGVV